MPKQDVNIIFISLICTIHCILRCYSHRETRLLLEVHKTPIQMPSAGP
jgi:hypothetical protein